MHSSESAGGGPARRSCVEGSAASAMAELAIKHDRIKLPLRLNSFYELYKKFLKGRGCKWHDVSNLLNVLAELVFDVDNVCSHISGKVSPQILL